MVVVVDKNAKSASRDGPRLPATQVYFVFSRWNQWALSRAKRELRGSSSQPAGLPDSKSGPVPIASQPLDEKDTSRNPVAR